MNSDYLVSFVGLIDAYPPITNPLSQTETFLTLLRFEFPVFETLRDPLWWTRVSKLSVSEAIDEIRKTNLDLNNIDLEWKALLSKQRFNFHNLCSAYKVDSLPIKVHLFKANAYDTDVNDILKKDVDEHKKVFNFPKLGWEKHVDSAEILAVPIEGTHLTMMTDPKNRYRLGKNITRCLLRKM